MNAEVNYIVDLPLQEAESFSALKQKGLGYIKAIAGHRWSNFNESDPGVTILDQLCYALTELAYCSDFPIEDILTRADNKIRYKNQFFAPEDILTTGPVTLEDYRKIVLDREASISNIYFYLVKSDRGEYTGAYESYIYQKNGGDGIVARVYSLLNESRNLGELFLTPKILKKINIEITGSLTLEKNVQPEDIYKAILLALDKYVSPAIKQFGFDQLINHGISSGQIFDGPRLANGWIHESLGEKRTKVRITDLKAILANVVGVASVNQLNLSAQNDSSEQNEVSIGRSEVANILLSDKFVLVQNGVSIFPEQREMSELNLARIKNEQSNASVEAAVHPYPKLPEGDYRDIETYYSVQNTFPDVYGIGENSITNDASVYRVAQSRQLKGYLMVFDQLLANQFSQLANLDELLCFQPKNLRIFKNNTKHIYDQNFSTTYYYQPLYHVPDVKSLLLGHNAYNFRYDNNLNTLLAEKDAWGKFKKDPFNQYIYGLRQTMEDELEAEIRRDLVLNHLMARHGDDYSLYNDMMKTYQWFMGEKKTQIIVKSIWLQNTEILSYFRNQAFNPVRASAVSKAGEFYLERESLERMKNNAIPSKYVDSISRLMSSYFSDAEELRKYVYGLSLKAGASRDEARHILKYLSVGTINNDFLNPGGKYAILPTIDGQVDQLRIYEHARISRQDLYNFSTYELKLSILLGLQQHMLILAEKLVLLMSDEKFNLWLKKSEQGDCSSPTVNGGLHIVRSNGLDQLYEGEKCLMDITWPRKNKNLSPPQLNEYQGYLNQLNWLAQRRKGFILIEHHQLLLSPNQLKTAPNAYFLEASILYPKYISAFQENNFRVFLSLLQHEHWPAHVGLNTYSSSYTHLKSFIHNFSIWRSGLRKGYGEDKKIPKSTKLNYWRKSTLALAALLHLPVLPDLEGAAHAK